ncbi:4Fe-4S dicluster domain-containing protein [Halobacteriaceae archaeon GCM10025711]
MAEAWAFYFDPGKCIGCSACTVACKQSKGIDPDGPDWRRVDHVGTGEFPDYEETTVSVSCMHCANPPCEQVCPTGAITKRDTDGIVTVDRESCIGCRYCGWACPYGAPQYDAKGLMQKCNLCLGDGPGEGHGKPAKEKPEDGGTKPACVDTCVGGALHAGTVSEMMELASEEATRRFAERDTSVIVEPTGPDDPVDRLAGD